MLDRALLARYLRQRQELGERELYLETLAAGDALRAVTPGAAGRQATTAPAAATGTPTAGSAGTPAIAPGPGRALLREVLGGGGEAGAASAPPGMPPGADSGESAGRLAVLGAQAAGCTACRLAESRRSVVFGEGSPAARLVVVGEAPGQEEDRTGRPFVGQAGKLLDLLLMSVGFRRDEVYICNTLKCRPPQNRNPQPDELAACSGYLKGQLAAIGPRVLLAVGKFAAQSLVGSEESISRLRGRVFVHDGIPLVVSYHPAFLLRSPQWTRTAWDDLQLVRKVLDEQA